MTDKPIEDMSPEQAAEEMNLIMAEVLTRNLMQGKGKPMGSWISEGIVNAILPIIKVQRQAAVADLRAKNEALSEDLDKMTKRCLFAEQQWSAFKHEYEMEKNNREALERDIAKLKLAICNDGSITDVEELVAFCEDLNHAYDKLGVIVEAYERADKAEAQAAAMRSGVMSLIRNYFKEHRHFNNLDEAICWLKENNFSTCVSDLDRLLVAIVEALQGKGEVDANR